MMHKYIFQIDNPDDDLSTNKFQFPSFLFTLLSPDEPPCLLNNLSYVLQGQFYDIV